MICFVTDIRSSVEPDILTLLKGDWLEIRSLNGEVLERIGAPSGGWTHERLVEQAELLEELTKEGAEAYLGGVWVGSTEV